MGLRLAIEKAIRDGVLSPGDTLPSERSIAALCGVSRPTVRKALDALSHADVIERRMGLGSFIAIKTIVLSDLDSFSDRVRASGSTPSSQWISARAVVNPTIAARLDLRPSEKIAELRRTRLVDDEPVMVESSYLDLGRFPWLLDMPDLGDSLYKQLRDLAGVEMASVDETVAPALAGHYAAQLQCQPNQPVLRRELLAFDRIGRPVEHSVGVVRGDRYVYSIHLSAAGNSTVTLTTARPQIDRQQV